MVISGKQMGKKRKNKKQRGKAHHPSNPSEVLIRSKRDALLKAEREYWSHQQRLHQNYNAIAAALAEEPYLLPEDISSIVWGLRDGAAFVRYKTLARKPSVEFRILDITLETWANEGLIVPTEKGEISLAKAGIIRGSGTTTMVNVGIGSPQLGSITIPFVALSSMQYGDSTSLPSVEKAVIDFQLTLLGMQVQGGILHVRDQEQPSNKDSSLAKLEKIAEEFENLLSNAEREEELQVFLKETPFILHTSADVIPKQKLGEDFVTDFVLVAPFEQGPVYFLVEIERASHPVLNQDGSIAKAANHALKQTRDWDMWLEQNKAYVQNKLPRFETPKYIVIIGRSNNMTDEQKAYLRSYNRGWQNLALYTYDDLLSQLKSTISRLKQI
jgi:hypothetical protein